jgi:hypothetical protein
VEFYVPLGGRGLLFRIGTLVIGVVGGMVYKRAFRRRHLPHINPCLPLPMAELIALD